MSISEQSASLVEPAGPKRPPETAAALGNGRLPAHGSIVVGVDGSPESKTAVSWAAQEAHTRGRALHMVHSGYLPAAGYLGFEPYALDFDALERAGESVLAALAARMRIEYPGTTVTTQLAHGDPVTELLALQPFSQTTVIGYHGANRLSGVLLGSVALTLASAATKPLVVVPHIDAPARTGPVVVGVDGSPASAAAVEFAFDEASFRGVDLIAVHSWKDRVYDEDYLAVEEILRIDAPQEHEREVLAQNLAGWRERYPDVTVHSRVVIGKATEALLKYGWEAQLIVVGNRGRGGFAGLLLGSTSHALITHCPCPVAVVRANA